MDHLSPLDVSFVHMEDADRTAHMHVASIGIFEGPPPPQDEIATVFDERLSLVPRYRQRLQAVPLALARPVWVDDTDFDLDYHLRRTALAAPGGDDELRRLVGRIMSQRLDRTKPLWETWIVEGLADDQWAIIGKTHHCMVDGVSGAELMAVLLDLTPEVARHAVDEWVPTPTSTQALAADAVAALATNTTEQVRAARAALRRPGEVVRQLGEIAGGFRTLSNLARPQADSGELTGAIGTHRVFAWADASLDDVKQIRAELGGTVNDVVLAALTNGYRAWLDERGEVVDQDRTVRTLVPVSVRATRQDGAATGDGTMANKVSAMFASLPVGLDDPTKRLQAITAELTDLKESKQALAAEALTSLGGFAPPALLALGSRVAIRSMTASGGLPIDTITTNVPGPQFPLYAGGRRMLRAYPYVPIISPMRIGVSIFSYDGQLTIGVTGDRDESVDVDVLAVGFADGLADLLRIARKARIKPRAKKTTRRSAAS